MKNLFLAVLLTLPVAAFAAKKDTGTYKVDTKESIAKWEGRKLGGAHQGELKLKSGEVTMDKDALKGGEFVIDMTTLKDNDLSDGELNTKLVNHLKSNDFFSVEKNPTSTFKITKVENKDSKTMVTGDLTIKGITHPVTFPVDVKTEKNKVKASGTMTVDRTMYDIKFRSLKFFADIGDKVIKDEFTVAVDLTATK